jgi:hypothetical protein
MHWFQVLNVSEQDAVEPILISLLVRLRNLQVTIQNNRTLMHYHFYWHDVGIL